MKDWGGQVAINVVAAVILAIFIVWFGVPRQPVVITFGAIYFVFGLLVLFVPLDTQRAGLDRRASSIYFIWTIALFPILYLLLREGLSIGIEKAYTLIILTFYAGLFGLSMLSLVGRGPKSQSTFIGHAASVVCFQRDGTRLLTFLILNRNHNLWLLPGGHLDIAHDDPSVVARHRILSELGHESTIVAVGEFQSKTYENIEILEGCHAFYRVTLGPGKCHDVHFDFAFVCELGKRVSVPKYESICIDITGCQGPADIAGRLRLVLEEYYRSRGRPFPTAALPPDIADRIFAGKLAYESAKACQA